MRDVFVLWPVVGAGTVDDAFVTTYLCLSWQAQARMLLGGVTCFDGTTGLPLPGMDGTSAQGQAISGAEELADYGSHKLMWHPASDAWAARVDAALTGYMALAFSLDDLRAQTATMRDDAEGRLRAWAPRLGWADPITAAVDAIDSIAGRSEGADAVHAYYSAVIDPAVPTPTKVPDLIRPNGGGFDVAVARAYDGAGSLANPVTVGDLGYTAILCRETSDQIADLV